MNGLHDTSTNRLDFFYDYFVDGIKDWIWLGGKSLEMSLGAESSWKHAGQVEPVGRRGWH